MDAIVVTSRIRPAAQIFQQLEQDPEGVIRDIVHVFGDLLVDHTVDRIRGGAAARPESVPPAAAAPTREEAEPVGLPPGPTEMETLRGRIASLEAANHGLQDTIARMSREREMLQAGAAKVNREPRETARARAATPPEKPPGENGADLIDAAGIARLIGHSKSRVGQLVREHADFPKRAAKRGLRFLWRRSEVDAWLAQHPAKWPAAAPPVSRIEPAASSEFLTSRQVAASLGTTLGAFYMMIHDGKFPKHSRAEGPKHFWTRADVGAWIAQRPRKPKPPADPGATEGQGRASSGKTCATCADLRTVGRRSICRCESEDNPHRNTSRRPTDTCDWHRRTNASAYQSVRPDLED